MIEVQDVAELSEVGLSYRCEQQTRRFWQNLTSDSRYCFELFRRALSDPHHEDSKRIWGILHLRYQRQAMLWVKRHRSFPSTRLEPDILADLALEKMWVSFANSKEDKFAKFPPEPERGLKALLRFLQTCIHSVVLDSLHREDAPLPGTDDEDNLLEPGEEDPDTLAAQDFWACIHQRLKNEKERIVVDACYVHNLKPRQIFEMYSETFATVKEIHRTKENVLARLRRDASLVTCFE